MTKHDRLLFAPLPGLYLRALETERQLKAWGGDGYTAYRPANREDCLSTVLLKISYNKDYILLRQISTGLSKYKILNLFIDSFDYTIISKH
jgi:hypothetical protein